MKRIFYLTTISIIALLVYFLFINSSNNRSKETNYVPDPSITPSIGVVAEEVVVKYQNGNADYKVSWITVRDNEKIELISNIDEQLTTDEAAAKYNCKHLINAGFIDTSNNHIGLFKNHTGEISVAKTNQTFNGFFSVSINKIVDISYERPNNTEIALQSGPILFSDNKPAVLKLFNDKYSRRVVVAINRKKEPIFIVFYSKGSPLMGPKLKELPSLLEDIEINTSLNITDAINLDGGSHSAFLSDNVKLAESSIIGGYFCITP